MSTVWKPTGCTLTPIRHPAMITSPPSIYRFGTFELDLQTGELRKSGAKLKVQEQSLQVLAALLAQPGAAVTREELREKLWPADTFVDFDHSINAAIKRLREVLSDEAESPRFIETLPRRGYRFIAPVNSPFGGAPTTWTRHKLPRLIVYTSALLAVLAGAAWLYFSRGVESKLPTPRVVPVTSLSDSAEDASLSPDGNVVAFKRSSDLPEVSGIYIQQIGSDHLLQLSKSTTDFSPVWSPDGRFIAFSRYANAEHEIYLVSAMGGKERQLHSGAPAHPPLSWSPDGKFIAFTAKDSDHNTYSINLLSVQSLETRKVTEPTAEYQDWAPAFSPDGKQLAFIRTNGALNMADIFVMPANGGTVRRLTFDNASIPDPPTWTPDGRSIVFSSPRISIPTLWRIPASGGEPVQVPQVGVIAVHPSVSAGGNRLAYDQIMGRSSIWSLQLAKLGKRDSRMLVTASGGFNWAPEFSPDGKRIAFLSGRLGPLEVWTCNRDGSDLIQLTNLGGAISAGPPRWSPDSQRIAFDSSLGQHNAIFVMKAEGGLARPLTRGASDNVNASWSRDGKWIYFTSNRSGQWQIWKMPSEGGEPLQLTKQGGFRAFESADGKVIYYAKTTSDSDIWRVPSSGGQESPVSPRLHVQQWRDWALVDNGIFFSDQLSAPHPLLRFFDFATARVNDVTTLEKPGEWISASGDGKFVLYHQFDHEESNIMLLENFR
jgi:Tol biopolymer transport system component/DNA-binding winged helix-turn-helix (wHTH) protein